MTRRHPLRRTRSTRPFLLEPLEERTLLTATPTTIAMVLDHGGTVASVYIKALDGRRISGDVSFTSDSSINNGFVPVNDSRVGTLTIGVVKAGIRFAAGPHTLVATDEGDAFHATSQVTLNFTVPPAALLVLGPPAGDHGHVLAVNFASGITRGYEPFGNFNGALSVAAGDVNGDGFPDVDVAIASGGPPVVQLLDFQSGRLLKAFYAFDPSFTGGVNLAVGDLNGDGHDDIIVGMASKGSRIREFSGADGSLLASISPFGAFTGGVRLAAGFLDNDNNADLAVSTGPGADILKVFLGDSTTATTSKLYAGSEHGGGYVAIGDYDHNLADGREIVLGTGAGDLPVVQVLTLNGSPITHFNFLPINNLNNTGVYVAFADLNRDGVDDFIFNPVTTNAISIDDGATHTLNHPLTAIFAGFTRISPGFSLATYAQTPRTT